MMQKLIYSVLVLLLCCISCSKEDEDGYVGSYVPVVIQQDSFNGKITDADNLASEQVINNLSIFITEPGADEFFYSAVRNVSFTPVDDYRLVMLPLELSTLGRKDIYVVANLDNSSISQAKNLRDLKALSTPTASKNNNLNPVNGFCMFGETLNFDFNNEENAPAEVHAVRTCAKYRITLTFPENPALSSSNAFVIKGVASHTSIGEGIKTDPKFFDFATPIPLLPNEKGAYSNVTYVYEANEAPEIGIYLNYSNSSKYADYKAYLPVPERNHLYDIKIQVYDTRSTLKNQEELSANYAFETTITTYKTGS